MTDRPPSGISRLTWVLAAASAIAIALLMAVGLLFTSYLIATPSMQPALEMGDYALVSRFDDSPERGDVVVWKDPTPTSPIDESVHRVIGLAGDELQTIDGVVHRNGEPLDESYLAEGTVTSGLKHIVVPDGEMFLLGDLRETSLDSRRQGTVPVDTTVGVVVHSGERWHVILMVIAASLTFLTVVSHIGARRSSPTEPNWVASHDV